MGAFSPRLRQCGHLQIFRYYRQALHGPQGDHVPLPVRWRYKLDHWRAAVASFFQTQRPAPRPRLCPACGTLVGATSSRCHQCGASMTFSMAAASRSLSRFLPQAAPVTYGLLTFCSLLYVVSLLATMKRSGFVTPGGGLGALFNLGGIDNSILIRMGESLPWPYNLAQPWRLVTAIFLHGGLLHIGFNMWIFMDLGPILEELYGSARYFFVFVITGVIGYVASSFTGHLSVGASGALLGVIGALFALSSGTQNIGMRMLRSRLIPFLIYVAVIGFLPALHVDIWAHAGGFASGFLLGKVMAGRPPADPSERRRANVLGWAAGLVVFASMAFMLLNYFSSGPGGG
jgi:rhomboid protease GluP